MTLKEGKIFTIINPRLLEKRYRGFKYMRLKYWDGRSWIVTFFDKDDSDWVAMSDSKIFSMLGNRIIREPNVNEKLEIQIINIK